ncbi:septation protein SepH [Saccharomonospora saliphila]|uniref:septation protein SepH n=1 Tax=Saccharomonospora saliphila TaxID=369829 RepID=UPI0003A5B66F|nr:septation protein SepH [Saccharomonospora saliphila]
MRTLRVVGLHEDGTSLVCEDPERRERFLLPVDERLRAAARGDVARLGQIEIEQESTMRPREIQSRIRAGESVEQVASAAGMPTSRIERFAHPVLLERSRTADLAQRAHPVREDGPDVRTLGEIVAHSFGLWGQDYARAEWDAWRSDEGKWVIGLRWSAGRSDNHAHWSFSPGAHGGTVTALDEQAEALLDPDSHRMPRPVGESGRDSEEAGTQDAHQTGREGARVIEAPLPGPADDDGVSPASSAPGGATAAPGDGEDERLVPEQAGHAATASRGKPPRKKNTHPAVPAWEDVLLGVRSQRG